MTNPWEQKTDSESFRKRSDDSASDEIPLEVEQRLRSQLESFRHRLDPRDARIVNHTSDSGRLMKIKGRNSMSVSRFVELIGLILVVCLGFGLILWAIT